MQQSTTPELFSAAYACLTCDHIETKLELVFALNQSLQQGRINIHSNQSIIESVLTPGRPAKPVMVAAQAVNKRKLSTPDGRSAFIHSLAHIEFNAINLALDAVYRFREMPREFHADWLQVAMEEAGHFILLRDHLRTKGHDYGDFTAHNGLWEMAVVTDHDPLVRMALVPRVLEARGLDVLPGIMHKFASCGANDTVHILQKIMDDEIGHVAIGNRWYAWLCRQRNVEPLETFRSLLHQYKADRFRGPFETGARRAAGFSEAELQMLEATFRTSAGDNAVQSGAGNDL
jgi:uncharacterized ferritin-like protein (DUF455 family)